MSAPPEETSDAAGRIAGLRLLLVCAMTVGAGTALCALKLLSGTEWVDLATAAIYGFAGRDGLVRGSRAIASRTRPQPRAGE